MTSRTNARVAGFTFLFYIVIGISTLILMGKASQGQGIAAQLASIARHASVVRVSAVLDLLCGFCALTLGVTLYAITRVVDPDLAMLGLTFRVAEGVIGGFSIQSALGLLWAATATGANAPSSEAAQGLGAYLLHGQGSGSSAMFFGVGSLLFASLLLRGRMIPAALAWIGVLASIVWVVGLPLQTLRVLPESATWFVALPMLAFEAPLGLWLLIKGVVGPQPAPVR